MTPIKTVAAVAVTLATAYFSAPARAGDGQLFCAASDAGGNVIRSISPILAQNGRPQICREWAEALQIKYGNGAQFVTLCWLSRNNVVTGTLNDDNPDHLPGVCR